MAGFYCCDFVRVFLFYFILFCFILFTNVDSFPISLIRLNESKRALSSYVAPQLLAQIAPEAESFIVTMKCILFEKHILLFFNKA